MRSAAQCREAAADQTVLTALMAGMTVALSAVPMATAAFLTVVLWFPFLDRQSPRPSAFSRAVAASIDVVLVFLFVLGTMAVLWMVSFIIDPMSPTTPTTP